MYRYIDDYFNPRIIIISSSSNSHHHLYIHNCDRRQKYRIFMCNYKICLGIILEQITLVSFSLLYELFSSMLQNIKDMIVLILINQTFLCTLYSKLLTMQKIYLKIS